MMNDPIADMLTRIRNASRASLPTVAIPHSRVKESIAQLLQREGYIAAVSVAGDKKRTLTLELKYVNRQPAIEGMRRISKPGLRTYVGATEIPRVRNGMGTAIVSTSRGLVSGGEARRQNIGGELLCYIW